MTIVKYKGNFFTELKSIIGFITYDTGDRIVEVRFYNPVSKTYADYNLDTLDLETVGDI